MFLFLKYLFLGISLAAPIGPVNAAQMDRGLRMGFLHAWMVGLGATIADAIYMLFVYLGFVRFLDTPIIQTFLWLFGSFVLLYTGAESILNAGKKFLNKMENNERISRSFLSGFFLSLTNPLTILFWLGIYGSVLAETASSFSVQHLLVYSSAIFMGILVWDVTMAGIASQFRNLLADKLLYMISLGSGISLIGFGIWFGYKALVFFM
jgi:L-lysine exporter family protein LysE/ArgO